MRNIRICSLSYLNFLSKKKRLSDLQAQTSVQIRLKPSIYKFVTKINGSYFASLLAQSLPVTFHK